MRNLQEPLFWRASVNGCFRLCKGFQKEFSHLEALQSYIWNPVKYLRWGFFAKIVNQKVVNYFNNEVPSRMFDWVLNVRLCTFNTWRVFKKTCSLFGFSLNLFLGGFFSYCFSKYGFHKRLCMNREIKHRLKSRD